MLRDNNNQSCFIPVILLLLLNSGGDGSSGGVRLYTCVLLGVYVCMCVSLYAHFLSF